MPILFSLLAFAVFVQGTSEFVLAGLLAGIALDLDVSLGQAGLLTSAFAVGMIVGAPAMAIAGRRLSPRLTLTMFLVVFIVVHGIGAVTDSFVVLLATRVIAALANAGFLAVALSTVTRIVPGDKQARALSIILGGTALALIVGVPAGAFVASALGWRATLWAIVAASVPALIAVAAAAPTVSEQSHRPSAVKGITQELATLRLPRLQLNLMLGVLVNAATFCTFTYLAIIATESAGFTSASVAVLLAVFGVGAFLGVTVAGHFGDQHWTRTISLTSPLLAFGWGVLAVLAQSTIAVWVLALVLGALSFALGSTLIARIVVTADGAPTLAGAFATVALNLGACVGPIVGGFAIEAAGVRGPVVVSAALVLLATLLWAGARRTSRLGWDHD